MNLPEYVPQWYVWVLGVLLPLLENFIISKNWSSSLKVLVAFGVSVLAGLGACYFGGKFDPQNILITIGTIFTLAQVMYDSFWKKVA